MKALHWKRIILEPPPEQKEGAAADGAEPRPKLFWELVKEPKFAVEQFEELFSQKASAAAGPAKEKQKPAVVKSLDPSEGCFGKDARTTNLLQMLCEAMEKSGGSIPAGCT